MTEGFLRSVKVIEYGNLISAPYCAKLLAGLGAEVIKIEKLGSGDEARSHGPFPNDIPVPERSGLFLSLNTNKLGITLNLDTVTGRDILKRLLKEADVFVENNPPQRMKELGLDYKSLEKINPRLIMASITPFGQSGPYRDYKAYDINCCAAGGLSVGIGYPDREPLTMPLSQGGYQAGAAAAGAILVALMARRRSGEGQAIDISEIEVLANLHAGHHILIFIYQGVVGVRQGAHSGYFLYPNVLLPCKDGYMCLAIPEEDQWLRFLEMMGNPGWSQKPRYQARRAMQEEYPEEVDALLTAWLKQYTMNEITEMCIRRRIPCSPVYTTAQLMEHPHLKMRHFFSELEHKRAGVLKYPGEPYKFSRARGQARRAAPLLGEHNEEVFCRRLGFSNKELANLRRSGVI
jgi:crotonobetainyl-CoA:carnitine CoA-transferase CaiB-like acyl-CoA transferase